MAGDQAVAGIERGEHSREFRAAPGAHRVQQRPGRSAREDVALAGRDVRLWHVDEDGTPPGLRTVQPSSSITGTALALMRALGWRKFEVWGWDACFINGLDHAAPQPIAPINVVTVVLGEGPDAKGFHTTPTWAHEAEGAWKRLWGADYQVDVRGPGLIAEMLRFQGVTKQTEGLAA